VQLALDPIREGHWVLEETIDCLSAGGVQLLSGMMAMRGEDYSTLESIRMTGGVVPDKHWSDNLAAVQRHARLAARCGVDLVTFHAGFIPHVRDPRRATLLDRLRAVADCLAAEGVRVGLETGQERAETLLEVLDELQHPAVGINFDPANMLLYGMGDPVEALALLTSHVVQIHIKDAVQTERPGTWGTEVVVGQGQVDWAAFFDVVLSLEEPCDLVIEREAGPQRADDIRTASQLIHGFLERK
jgi:sugar phosphate isomerase/epimerase